LQSYYHLFQQLNAEVLFIAQLEKDISLLPRIETFVKNDFIIVCDPEQISRKPYVLFNAYIIDKKGIIRTRVPGSLSARPNLDMILEELSKVEGKPVPKQDPNKQITQQTEESSPTAIGPQEVISVSWMWSHTAVAEGDQFKLAFLPQLAEGFHVYAPNEKRMSPFKIEFELPEGIEITQPITYPKPDEKEDPFLKIKVLQYENDIPIQAIQFKAKDGLKPSTLEVKAKLHFQACNDSLCYPPNIKEITLPLTVVSKETKRSQVSGWKRW
jgi:hypothetical protein